MIVTSLVWLCEDSCLQQLLFFTERIFNINLISQIFLKETNLVHLLSDVIKQKPHQ